MEISNRSAAMNELMDYNDPSSWVSGSKYFFVISIRTAHTQVRASISLILMIRICTYFIECRNLEKDLIIRTVIV